MKNLRLVIFASTLHNNASVMNSRAQLFESLRKNATVEIIYPTMLQANTSRISKYLDGGVSGMKMEQKQDGDSRTVCFIATGGTEEIFKNYLEALPTPVIILSDGFHNSFAAALEISTYLGQRGIEKRLYNAPLIHSEEFFTRFVEEIFCEEPKEQESSSGEPMPKFSKNVLKGLEKSKIGIIGGSSSWLISSDIDRDAVTKEYGTQFIDIEMKELEKNFGLIDRNNPEISRIMASMSRYLTPERSEDDLREAARMYIAIRRICKDNELNAVTIKCFGILKSCQTTACLALALLNDEGIVAGCEGDIQTLWTMLYARLAKGTATFMANPSSTNREELTIDLAHCTIPLSMVHGYRLPSHFESSIGIGISGSVPSGRYRIIKFSGEKLDSFFSAEGNIIMNTNVPQRCRTQVRFKFNSEKDFDRFLSANKGNHVVLLPD